MSKNIKTLNSSQLLSEIGITDWSDLDFTVVYNQQPNKLSISYPFRSTDYLLGFVANGFVRFKINLQEITLHKNSLIVVKPHDVMETISESDDFKVNGLSFTKEFIVNHATDISLLDNLECLKQNEAPIITIEEDVIEMQENLFSMIDFLAKNKDNPHRKKMIKSLFEMILYGIDAAFYKKGKVSTVKKISRKDELTKQFRKLLLENYKEQRSVSFYADNLFVTAKYLSDVVKTVTGKTAGEMIDETVILEAKILLKNSTNTIAEIADMLHFSDQFFFSSFFKKHTGLSPSHYRNLP